MICIVNASNRCGFERELAEMYRQRSCVPDPAGGPGAGPAAEIDSYDRVDATYLIARQDGGRGAVLASARLLPTDRPHPMRDRFAESCLGPMPGGSAIWEVSRFSIHPDVRRRRERAVLLHQMTCAVMETSLLFGIEAVIVLAGTHLLRYVLNCGWTATVLGPTLHFTDAELTAVEALITPDGLRSARRRFGMHAPVTRFPVAARIAA